MVKLKGIKASLVGTSALLVPALALALTHIVHDGGRDFVHGIAAGSDDAIRTALELAMTAAIATVGIQARGTLDRLRRVSNRVEQLFEDHEEAKRSDDSAVCISDVPAAWAGFEYAYTAFNPAIPEQVIATLPKGKGYVIRPIPERTDLWYARFQKRMKITFVVHAPRRLGFGTHPAEILLKILNLTHECRARAKIEKKKLQASIRVLLIDAPRPTGSYFLAYRLRADHLESYVLEYVRSSNSDENTPTAETLLRRHTNQKTVEKINDYIEHQIERAFELGVGAVNQIVGPLLPQKDGAIAPVISAARWKSVLEQLYCAGVGETFEVVDQGGSFRMSSRGPSLSVDRTVDSDISAMSPIITAIPISL